MLLPVQVPAVRGGEKAPGNPSTHQDHGILPSPCLAGEVVCDTTNCCNTQTHYCLNGMCHPYE
jgi:hypothetical protein